MSDKIKIPELDIEVEDVDEFNDEASEHLTGFCQGLEDAGETRSPTEEELVEDDWLFMWTDNAIKLIEDEISRLYEIGEKYFGEGIENGLDISTHMYKD